MSLYDALLNTIYNNIKGLSDEAKRCHNICNILEIATRTSMGVNSTDSYILLTVQVAISAEIWDCQSLAWMNIRVHVS